MFSFSWSRQFAFLWICLYISICRSTTGLSNCLPTCKPVNRSWHIRDSLFLGCQGKVMVSTMVQGSICQRIGWGVAAQPGTFFFLSMWWLKIVIATAGEKYQYIYIYDITTVLCWWKSAKRFCVFMLHTCRTVCSRVCLDQAPSIVQCSRLTQSRHPQDVKICIWEDN